MTISNLFNNREISILIWSLVLLLFFIFILASKKKLKLLEDLIKKFFQWKIQSVILTMIGYILIEVLILQKIGIWNLGQLKNTIIWFFSVAFISIFQKEAIKKDGRYFKRIIWDNLKLIAVFQFIVDFYTFSLLTELIIVPVLAFIGLLAAFADLKKEHSKANIFLEKILSLLGIGFLLHAFSKILVTPKDFLNQETGLDFITPITLTILFIPFLFWLVVISSYETFSILLKTYIKDDRKRAFAKIVATILFNVRIKVYQRWLNSLYKENTNTYSGLILSFKKILKARKAEQNPKFVKRFEGWSPYKIKDVLRNHGIITGFYKESSYSEWNACSNYLEIGEGFLTSKIAYYVIGKEDVATETEISTRYKPI